MGIVLFSEGSVTLRQGVNIDVEFAIDEGVEGIKSTMIVSAVGTDTGANLDAFIDDPRTLNAHADVIPHWSRPKSVTAVSFLMHKDFADFECRYASFTDELAEQVKGRLNKAMQPIANSDGTYCNNTHAANTPHCLTATAHDGRVVIIEPFNCDVRTLDKFGKIILNKMLPTGTFENLIGITADDEYIWLLHWDTTCYHGGNKYIIQARTWDDLTLVEYELLGNGLSIDLSLAEDFFAKVDADVREAWSVLLTNAIITDNALVNLDVELEEIFHSVFLGGIIATDMMLPVEAIIDTVYAIDIGVEFVDVVTGRGVSAGYTLVEDTVLVTLGATIVVSDDPDADQSISLGVGLADDMMVTIDTDLNTGYAVELDADVQPPIWYVKLHATVMDPEFEARHPKIDLPFRRDLMTRDPSTYPEYDRPEPITIYEELNQRYGSYNLEGDAWYYLDKGSLSYDEYMEAKDISPLPTHPLAKAHVLNKDHSTAAWDYDVLPDGEDKCSIYLQQERQVGYITYRGDRAFWDLQDMFLGSGPSSTYLTYEQNYSKYYFDPIVNPLRKNNVRYVSNPKIVASETKLFFVMSTRRGSWPWQAPGLSDDDIQRRSSYSLIYEIDKGIRWPNNPKGVPMSGAMDIQARDSIGLVMMDNFVQANLTDDYTALPGYHSYPDDIRKVDIIAYDTTTLIRASQRLEFSPQDDRDISFPSEEPHITLHDLEGVIITSDRIASWHHHFECDYSYGSQLRLSDTVIAVAFALIGQAESELVVDDSLDMAGLIQVLAPDLTGDTLLLAPRLPHLLNTLAIDIPISINLMADIHPHDTAYFTKLDAVVWYQGLGVVRLGADITTNNALALDVVLEDLGGLKLDATIKDVGYWDEYKIITNNCPIDAPDPGRNDYDWDFAMRTTGTYMLSTFVWYPGYGEDKDGNTVASWRFKYKDPTQPNSYFPHPVQYVVDDDTGEQFGLFRLFESGEPLGDYEFIDPISEETFIMGTNHIEDFRVMNYPIGGVLHKYDDILKDPVQSIAMPGYFNQPTVGEFDPFVQYRHLGISTTHKRLYVIRAMGRRDYWHFNAHMYTRSYGAATYEGVPSLMGNRYGSPYGGSEELNLKSPTPYFDPELGRDTWITPRYVIVNNDTWLAEDFTCNNGVYQRDVNDYTPIGAVDKTLVDKDYARTDVDELYTDQYNPNLHRRIIDRDALTDYDQTENTYTERDILVYDYKFNYITRLVGLSGLADDDVIMHIREKDGTYYILTQAKGEAYNWGQFAVDRSLPRVSTNPGVGDDKHGWIYKEMRLYAIQDIISNRAELVYSLPYGTHASNDVLIQVITDTHVWLNWDAIRKVRSAKVLGLAIKRDGSGHSSVPGLVAVVPDKYIDGEYSLLCYKHPAYGGRRFESSKLTRWGREGSNELVVYKESNLRKYTKDYVFAPPEDTPLRGTLNEVLNHVSGMQPGYSQVVYQRHYPWVKLDATIRDSKETIKPRTWIKITDGGPQVI